jgi:hypothetical protein
MNGKELSNQGQEREICNETCGLCAQSDKIAYRCLERVVKEISLESENGYLSGNRNRRVR